MPTLTLADTLAIAGVERELLVEADEVIRDAAAAVVAAAARDGLDPGLVSRGLVGVLLAAAARQTLSANPSMAKQDIADSFVELAAEAFDWASRRGVKPKGRS